MVRCASSPACRQATALLPALTATQQHLQQLSHICLQPARLEESLRREFTSLSAGIGAAVAPAVRAAIAQSPPPQAQSPLSI